MRGIRRIGRRGQVAGLAVGLLLVVLTVPAPAQDARGTLIHAQATVCADTLNQHLSNNTPCRMVARHVLDNLVAVNPADGTVNPWLAESWEITAGGRIYVFKLRRGVRFHDGTLFDAEAAKFNLERTLDPATRAPYRFLISRISSALRVPPPTTAIICRNPASVAARTRASSKTVPTPVPMCWGLM